MRQYFYTDGINKFGPFLKEELYNQKVSRSTKIWYYGLDNWKEISSITELEDLILSIPPEIKQNTKAIINSADNNKSGDLKLNTLQKKNKKWFNNKLIIGIILIVFFSILIFYLSELQSKVKFYKTVVANSYESNENFELYVDNFYRDLENYGIYPQKPKNIIIKFSKLDQLENTTHIHGISFGKNDDERIEIYINPSSWEKFNRPMKHFLIYHELSHDILNLNDIEAKSFNEGKLMYPEISNYENISMDDFIESFHNLFEEESKKRK